MSSTNLSKIQPKLRTEGRVSGNFGRNKVKAGSTLSDIGNGGTGRLPSKREWFFTLLEAWPQLPSSARVGLLPELRSLAATLGELPRLARVLGT